MRGFNLPYQPIPQQLYTRTELFRGFKPDKPASWGKTVDFRIYRHSVMKGGNEPTNPYMGMMQALHDNAITQSTRTLLARHKVAAIMGDHLMARDSKPYKQVAILARRLTRSSFLICTGGGPGAMEAGHLGASLAAATDSDLNNALSLLKTEPVLPAGLKNIVDTRGVVNSELVAKAHAWFKPAYEIAISINSPGESLAVPTWLYGQEPTTPLATHIAKYFQNSIREDGLLALAKQGIVFSEGKAGTIQELFQDGAQNNYKTFGCFSPMVLFGRQHWTRSYPVVSVLQKLFDPADFKKYVLVTDDVEAAAQFIEQFIP